jgi:hypothetical protein
MFDEGQKSPADAKKINPQPATATKYIAVQAYILMG